MGKAKVWVKLREGGAFTLITDKGINKNVDNNFCNDNSIGIVASDSTIECRKGQEPRMLFASDQQRF